MRITRRKLHSFLAGQEPDEHQKYGVEFVVSNSFLPSVKPTSQKIAYTIDTKDVRSCRPISTKDVVGQGGTPLEATFNINIIGVLLQKSTCLYLEISMLELALTTVQGLDASAAWSYETQ